MDGVLDHGAQFFQSLPLSVDAVPKSGSCIAAVSLVFPLGSMLHRPYSDNKPDWMYNPCSEEDSYDIF